MLAARAKSNFLSSMSHELRTPMNAILGFSQLLEADPTEPLTSSQKKNVGQILMAGEHLQGLIDRVLDLSRMEQGELVISPAAVTLGPIVAEALATVQPLAAQHQIAIEDNTAPLRHVEVWADESRLQQILLNLLTNATKFNHDGGTISLAGEITAAHRLRLTVGDTGPGIPEARLPDLFVPFKGLDSEHMTTEGAGISLAITKQLLEAMKGSIDVTSVVGEGSSFSIELDLAETPGTRSAQSQELCAETVPSDKSA